MSDFEIKCHNCGTIITADDVMEKHLAQQEKILEDKYKKKNNDEIKNKNQEIIELNKKIEDSKEDQEKKIQQAQAQGKALALKESENTINELNKKIEDSKEDQEKKIQQAQAQGILNGKNQSKEALDKIKKEKEIENRRLQATIDKLQNALTQKSVEVQGEVQEEVIEDFISKNFSGDTLETIKKGANGADSVLNIKVSNQDDIIGKILIESKNTKEFSDSWINKLLEDVKNINANCGIIITKSLPKKNFDSSLGYQAYHGGLIFVVEFKYALVNIMMQMLRNHIVNSFKINNRGDESEEMKQLWNFINSPAFTTQFRLIYSNMKKVDSFADKIDSTVRKTVADQKKAITSVINGQKEIILSLVQSVGTDALPKKLIEFDED